MLPHLHRLQSHTARASAATTQLHEVLVLTGVQVPPVGAYEEESTVQETDEGSFSQYDSSQAGFSGPPDNVEIPSEYQANTGSFV